MKYLALNTAGHSVEVALSTGGFFREEDGKCASATLMPHVNELLENAGLTLEDLNYIACVTGPGSFTGIRIGVSAVRSMCYALGKPALGIHELRMLAYNKRADGYEKILCVTDGSNGTAYICEYDADRKPLTDCLCVPMNEAIAKAESYKGVVCADERIATMLPNAVPSDSDCSALLGAAKELSECAGEWQNLVPEYVRESQAERDLKARAKSV